MHNFNVTVKLFEGKCIFNLVIERLLIELGRATYNATMFQSCNQESYPSIRITRLILSVKDRITDYINLSDTPSPSSVQSVLPNHVMLSV